MGIFRNDAVLGMKLLSNLWFQTDGKDFLKFVIPPVLNKIKPIKNALEVSFIFIFSLFFNEKFGRLILIEVKKWKKIWSNYLPFAISFWNNYIPPKNFFHSILTCPLKNLQEINLFCCFREMKELFRRLETRISLTHPLGGPILIGGLLVLRLMSPALIFPAKYDLYDGKLLTRD